MNNEVLSGVLLNAPQSPFVDSFITYLCVFEQFRSFYQREINKQW